MTNDTHSHFAPPAFRGNRTATAQIDSIELILRSYDRAGRYGGEEFLVLVSSEAADAQALCERLRSGIADQPFVEVQVALRVTVSGGFVPFTSRDTRAASELLASADNLLYEARAARRNRILFETTDPFARRA